MAAPQPFRLSSFFFSRAGSGRAATAECAAAAAVEPQPSGLSELEQSLLDRAEVDLEVGYDNKFVFSWRRLLLHMGCVGAVPAVGRRLGLAAVSGFGGGGKFGSHC